MDTTEGFTPSNLAIPARHAQLFAELCSGDVALTTPPVVTRLLGRGTYTVAELEGLLVEVA